MVLHETLVSADTMVLWIRRRHCDVMDAPSEKRRTMTTTELQRETAIESARARAIEMKLEVVVIPVSDVDRAKDFYAKLGWRLDADFVKGDAFRGVQFTPSGSSCSIHFGKGITSAEPGSAQGLFLVVSDIEAARKAILDRDVGVSEVFHRAVGEGPQSGPDPERRSYMSYATFKDPDGNVWLLQEVTARLPGRVEENVTTFASPFELSAALRRASAAHGEHEKRTGKHDANWPDWYAEYMVCEQAGKPLPQ